ncbi:MAG: YbjN domain-containing protein [Propionibacteriales bacterium]|nr:YbjN domain-containing protein [Propionibacteriales bacterium]
MGYFNKEATGGSAAPLTRKRVEEALERQGWLYRVDDDGDIYASWDEGYFWFFFYGENHEVLQVRGTWYGTLTATDEDQALRLANQINAEKLFPKLYTFLTDDGALQVRGELNVDYENGVTDEQLSLHLRAGIGSTLGAFGRFAEAFPEAAPAIEE